MFSKDNVNWVFESPTMTRLENFYFFYKTVGLHLNIKKLRISLNAPSWRHGL